MIERLTGGIAGVGQRLLDAVFPPRCVLCQCVIGPAAPDGLCPLCRWQDYCCEQPLDGAGESQDGASQAETGHVAASQDGAGRCSLVYEQQLQQAIYRMKYEGRRFYGVFFARWMFAEGADWAAQMHFDLVTAVPLAKERMKSRGYNQAEVIARELARLCRVPYAELLVRQKETRPQQGLGEAMRRQNVAGAFAVREGADGLQTPKRICLVDDIYTTGSTTAECIRLLQERWPGAQVQYWALARRSSEKNSGF